MLGCLNITWYVIQTDCGIWMNELTRERDQINEQYTGRVPWL
jgi:hypothetical protein